MSLITLTMDLFYSVVPLSHNSVTVTQQYQDPDTGAAKWDLVIINFIFTAVLLLLWHVKISPMKKT